MRHKVLEGTPIIMGEKITATTQQHLDIEDIKDDLVILKNGNITMVLETDSLNFELFAEDEQNARILAFASLLNSLTFTLQIVIRTERKDVDDYIEKLIQHREQQSSPALRKQMEIYIKFIKNLTVKTVVLDKRFFIVIPATFTPISTGFSLTGMLFGKKQSLDSMRNLSKAKDDLNPKRDFLVKQFKKMGIKAKQLINEELIQLYFDIYDPDKVGIKRVDLSEGDYTSGIVSSLKPDVNANR